MFTDGVDQRAIALFMRMKPSVVHSETSVLRVLPRHSETGRLSVNYLGCAADKNPVPELHSRVE